MKRKYAKIMFLSMTLLTSSITTAYATIPEDEKKEETQKGQAFTMIMAKNIR